jgi:hypothetical protein
MSQNKKRKRQRELEQRKRSRGRLAAQRKRAEPYDTLGIRSGISPLIFREYYQSAFIKMIQTARKSGAYASGPSAKRWEFWRQIAAKIYSPPDGAQLVKQFLQEVDEHIRTDISKNSIAYWLHLTRRIAPMPIGEDSRPATILHTRDALDAAIQKWGTFALCERIASSAEVVATAILRGYLVDLNDEQMIEALIAEPQLVLTDFGLNEMLAAAEIEKLAYETWRSMAKLRALGKGAELVVTGRASAPLEEHRSKELDYLIRNYDQRAEQNPFNATATGTVFEDPKLTAKKGMILLPRYNVQHITFKTLRTIFETFLKSPFRVMPSDHGGPNFIWSPFDLRSFYLFHRPLSDAFREKHLVSLESVLAVIAAISIWSVSGWQEQPAYFWRSWQRGYEGPLVMGELEEHLHDLMPAVLAQMELPFEPTKISVRDAVEFLTLSEEKRVKIDVAYPGPHYVFLPCGGERFFVDFAHIWTRLYYLFHGVTLSDQNFKGDALETFTRQGRSVLPTGELNGNDGTSRQVDAAFAVDDLLVIAECRVVARSIGVDRGDPRAMAVRRSVVEKALKDVDEKARWLAGHPVGKNYNASKYRTILPVGVTPFREFIPSTDEVYWISNGLPRVLCPDELLHHIENGILSRLAVNCPNIVRVGSL